MPVTEPFIFNRGYICFLFADSEVPALESAGWGKWRVWSGGWAFKWCGTCRFFTFKRKGLAYKHGDLKNNPLNSRCFFLGPLLFKKFLYLSCAKMVIQRTNQRKVL